MVDINNSEEPTAFTEVNVEGSVEYNENRYPYRWDNGTQAYELQGEKGLREERAKLSSKSKATTDKWSGLTFNGAQTLSP